MTDTTGPQRIVVGIDGSASSIDTLRWAVRQAQLTGSVVEALPPVELTRVVEEGESAITLVEWATHAALLVIGSRGHGAFVGMLIGSVSQYCVTHAHCPVVVLRGPER